ncbi:MAG: MFS transporter [Deltaproteobacteria bacterium]|nr:MFS transporter [Deltaproteobacteria bacterium]
MLRNPSLIILWGAELASRLGESVFQIALLWFLLEATGSAAATGLVTMVTYLPAFLVGLWAGVVVDRRDYRTTMLLASLARLILAAALPLLFILHSLPVTAVAGLGFLLSCASSFFGPARDAAIPLLSGGKDLLRANSLVQSAWQFSLVIGPFLAAAALPFIPVVQLFWMVALAFGLSLFMLLGLKPCRSRQGEGAASPAAFWADFRRGLAYLSGDRPVLWIWVITLVNNFFLMGPVFVGIPVLVRERLGGTASDYALVEGTYAAGMIVATWLISRHAGRFDPLRLLFVALIYDGLTYLPLYWIQSVPGTLAVIAIHSLGIPAITISRLTVLHARVPQEFQGRVFSYFHLAVAGMTALSIGLTGLVLEWLDSHILFAVIGLICASTGVAGFLLPAFRSFRMEGAPGK